MRVGHAVEHRLVGRGGTVRLELGRDVDRFAWPFRVCTCCAGNRDCGACTPAAYCRRSRSCRSPAEARRAGRPMTAIVDIIGREILDSRGNPTVEVDVVLEDGSLRPRRGALGRLDRRARGGRAARRRQEALSRQGRAQGGRGGQRRDLRRGRRHGRRGAGQDRRDADRARRHAEQGPARRQRHPRRLARGRQGGGRRQRPAALPLCRRHRRRGSCRCR